MRSITDAVRTIFAQDETAQEAAARGILNSSAYAREISDQVAEITWKEVEPSSVTVSVNRVIQEQDAPRLKPELTFDKISVETGLVDVTFERSREVAAMLRTKVPEIRREFSKDLFIESTSQSEVTMIMSVSLWERLQSETQLKPVVVYTNQVAISISFDESYLQIPNFIYAVLSIFALQRINLTEIVSTRTEIVIVIDSSYLDLALAGLKPFMR